MDSSDSTPKIIGLSLGSLAVIIASIYSYFQYRRRPPLSPTDQEARERYRHSQEFSQVRFAAFGMFAILIVLIIGGFVLGWNAEMVEGLAAMDMFIFTGFWYRQMRKYMPNSAELQEAELAREKAMRSMSTSHRLRFTLLMTAIFTTIILFYLSIANSR